MEAGLIAAITLAALFLIGAVVMAVFHERAQQRVRMADDRNRELEMIVEQSNDALLTIDIGDGRVHGANARAGELLGMDRPSLLAATIFNLCPPAALARCAERIAEVWEKRGWIFDDVPLMTASGEALAVECSARVSAFNGRPAIFLYVRDIRERLRLRAEIDRKNRDLLDSIRYAERIQKAMVPDSTVWGRGAPEHFVFFRPRDVVSGDFHWFACRDGILLAAAADCTGHGVPGALMSMIGATLLNTIVNERGISDPAQVLGALREGVAKAMGQEPYGVDANGMDVALVAYDPMSGALRFAGAQLPCVLVKRNALGIELLELAADRMPVGQHVRQNEPFTLRETHLHPGDALYLFTDGVPDQFGGPRRKRFSRAQLRTLLQEVNALPMSEQLALIDRRLSEWRGEEEQTDDMLLIGLRA